MKNMWYTKCPLFCLYNHPTYNTNTLYLIIYFSLIFTIFQTPTGKNNGVFFKVIIAPRTVPDILNFS